VRPGTDENGKPSTGAPSFTVLRRRAARVYERCFRRVPPRENSGDMSRENRGAENMKKGEIPAKRAQNSGKTGD
jgi:hypothetical protein